GHPVRWTSGIACLAVRIVPIAQNRGLDVGLPARPEKVRATAYAVVGRPRADDRVNERHADRCHRHGVAAAVDGKRGQYGRLDAPRWLRGGLSGPPSREVEDERSRRAGLSREKKHTADHT